MTNSKRVDFALSPEQRVDARDALRLLDGSGISLAEAARRALQGRRALNRVTVETATTAFLRTRLALRARTYEWYESNLNPFIEKFAGRMIDDVDRPSLFDWLKDMEEAPRRRLARAARALFRWCMAQEPQMVTVDPTVGMKTNSEGSGGEAEFLTVAEVEKIMKAAGPYQSALALLIFAGVRPEEMAGRAKPPLLWKHVRVDEKMIRIPAEISKTDKPRIIEGLPPTVWAFLQPGGDEAPVSPGRTRQANERAQGAIKRKWPHDAVRHTFCTYALALTNDAGKVSHWSGHEGKPAMLQRHYRGLATKAEAIKFFAITPSAR